MDFHAKKVDGKKTMAPAIAEMARRHWNSIKEGEEFTLSLTKIRAGKSQKQLGAIWGLMIAKAVLEFDEKAMDTSYLYGLSVPTGVPIKNGPLCDYLYSMCPIYTEINKRITLSKANTEEAAKFFDECRNHLASQFGIVIPDPNPNWRNEVDA